MWIDVTISSAQCHPTVPESVSKSVYLFTASNAKPDIDPIVFVIEPAGKNLVDVSK